MLKMFGFTALCYLVFSVAAGPPAFAADDALDLQNGAYELRLRTPQMAPGKKDIALPAEVEVKDGALVIHTQGMSGNKVTLKGTIKGGALKAGITEIEGAAILSFHYIGKVQTKHEARGKFYCFLDGKAAFTGEWTLTKKELESPKPAE